MNQNMMNQNMMNPNMMNNMMAQNMMAQNMMAQNMMTQMLAQQQNNNFNQGNTGNQNPNPSNSGSSSGGINVFFRKNGTGENDPPLMIQCMPNEKVSELIKRYRTKSGDHEPTKKFIFNAKQLNVTLNCAEAGLTNDSNIFVVATKDVKGAY